MKRRAHWSTITIAALLIIGLTTNMVRNPAQLLIPVLVFGGVFLLWKYPPTQWRKRKNVRSYSSPTNRTKSARDKRKPMPFKVIQGNKKDDKDSDPPYPYH